MSSILQANKIELSRWQAMDIFGQLGNVSSEVGRTFKSQARGNVEQVGSAFWRALELLDATISDPKNFQRGRELRRARELFCSVYFNTGEYSETPASVEKYFMHFALHNQHKKYSRQDDHLNEKIEIVDAAPDDAKDFYEIQKAGWLATYPNAAAGISYDDIAEFFKDADTRIARWKKRLTGLPNIGRGWTIRLNDKIAGYCIVERGEILNKIKVMYILPKYQHQGLGTRLMEIALEWLGDKSDITVEVAEYNNNALEFYKKFGFIYKGRVVNQSSGILPGGKIIPEVELLRTRKG